MYAAAMRVELRLFDVHSLKAKRGIVKQLIAHINRSFVVAIAEVDHHDLWQRTALGIAAVSGHPGHTERILHEVERQLRSRSDIEVLSVAVSHLEEPM